MYTIKKNVYFFEKVSLIYGELLVDKTHRSLLASLITIPSGQTVAKQLHVFYWSLILNFYPLFITMHYVFLSRQESVWVMHNC